MSSRVRAIDRVDASISGSEVAKDTRFKPGADPRRNLKGRPRSGLAISDLMRTRLEGGKGEAIVDGLIQRSLEGDDQATKILLDRAYGQPPQHVEMNTSVHTDTVEQVMALTRDYLMAFHPDEVLKYLEWMTREEAA